MNTGEVKFQLRLGKGHSKLKSTKKTLLSKVRYSTDLTAEEQELLKRTFEARDEWIENSTNFEHVHEAMLVDYYTYRLKACEARYAYFIKLVKEKQLTGYI